MYIKCLSKTKLTLLSDVGNKVKKRRKILVKSFTLKTENRVLLIGSILFC